MKPHEGFTTDLTGIQDGYMAPEIFLGRAGDKWFWDAGQLGMRFLAAKAGAAAEPYKDGRKIAGWFVDEDEDLYLLVVAHDGLSVSPVFHDKAKRAD